MGNSSEFKMLSKFQQKEKLREEILKQKELFSQHLILSNDLTNVVCERVEDAYYNEWLLWKGHEKIIKKFKSFKKILIVCHKDT